MQDFLYLGEGVNYLGKYVKVRKYDIRSIITNIIVYYDYNIESI